MDAHKRGDIGGDESFANVRSRYFPMCIADCREWMMAKPRKSGHDLKLRSSLRLTEYWLAKLMVSGARRTRLALPDWFQRADLWVDSGWQKVCTQAIDGKNQ